jgi:multisubunit Na+/H+ antiporter MnhG subunit
MTLRTMRRLGAIALLAVGAVHLQQYLGAGYRSIPTIGPLFLLNAVSSGVVAIGLLAPLERILHHRRAELASGLLAGAAVAVAAGSLVALFVSENGTLFGFSETGYSTAIVLAIIAEALAIVLLAPVAAVTLKRAAAGQSSPDTARAVSSP